MSMRLSQTATPSFVSDRRARSGASTFSARLAAIGCILAVAGLAIWLRAWDMNAAYGSGDQAMMPCLVRHSFGIAWIFERSYGPVTALFHRACAEMLYRGGLPMTETAERLGILVVGLAQIFMSYHLMRRLRCSNIVALAGAACTAVLPILVTDVRMTWAWGYLSIWLLTGTIAFWSTLAYFDERRGWQLALAGMSLAAHCLSNTYSFALPATLLLAWGSYIRSQRRLHANLSATLVPTCAGFVLPCFAALFAIGWIWWTTGAGPVGHLLRKHAMGSSGFQFDQLLQLPAMWSTLFGYLFGVIAAIGLLDATFNGNNRVRLLAAWAWLGLGPVLLAADWDCIGYPAAYFIEVNFAAGLLAILWLARLYQRYADRAWSRRALVLGGLIAVAHMTVGTADDCLGQGRYASITGIRNKPVELRADIGAKAAGWYVRRHVPVEAAVMSLHDNKGMESSVAELYLGRRVLAGWDLPKRILPALTSVMSDQVDVFIAGPSEQVLLENLAGFQRVAVLRNNSEPVRFIYARRTMSLPAVDEKIAVLNDLYDNQYAPQRVPIPLPAPSDYTVLLARYQQTANQLKTNDHQQVRVESPPSRRMVSYVHNVDH